MNKEGLVSRKVLGCPKCLKISPGDSILLSGAIVQVCPKCKQPTKEVIVEKKYRTTKKIHDSSEEFQKKYWKELLELNECPMCGIKWREHPSHSLSPEFKQLLANIGKL